MSPERAKRFVWSMVLVLVLVNAPMVSHLVNQQRLAADGEMVDAEVVDVTPSGDHFTVSFRVPAEVDPDRTLRAARVVHGVGQRARTTGEIVVRVVPDRPALFRASGQVRNPLSWILTGVLDVLVVGGLLLWWRRRRRESAEPDRDGGGDTGAADTLEA